MKGGVQPAEIWSRYAGSKERSYGIDVAQSLIFR